MSVRLLIRKSSSRGLIITTPRGNKVSRMALFGEDREGSRGDNTKNLSIDIGGKLRYTLDLPR